MIDLHQRKREATQRRIAELLALPGMYSIQELADILDRQYEAGVHDHSDYMEQSRLMAMEKARARFDAMRNTEPVAFMDVEPGKIIELVRQQP